MPIGLGDIVGQIGTGVYRLIKGKDVNIKAGANVTASGDGQYDDATVTDITIQPGDLILVDDVSVSYPDGAAGASGSVTGGGGQASTMTTSFASVWTFIQGQAGSGNGGLVPSAGSAGEFLAHDGSFAQVAYGNISGTPTIPPDLTSSGTGTINANNVPTLNQDTTGNADTVTTNANLTGHVTSSGNATSLGSFTLAQLNTAISDGTVGGSGDVSTDAIWDTKGDLVVGTGNNTAQHLDVGVNGEVLTADSSHTPWGVKWSKPKIIIKDEAANDEKEAEKIKIPTLTGGWDSTNKIATVSLPEVSAGLLSYIDTATSRASAAATDKFYIEGGVGHFYIKSYEPGSTSDTIQSSGNLEVSSGSGVGAFNHSAVGSVSVPNDAVNRTSGSTSLLSGSMQNDGSGNCTTNSVTIRTGGATTVNGNSVTNNTNITTGMSVSSNGDATSGSVTMKAGQASAPNGTATQGKVILGDDYHDIDIESKTNFLWNSDDAVGPSVTFKKTRGGSTAAVNGDKVGSIVFKGENSTGTEEITYGQVVAEAEGVADTDEHGKISLGVTTSNGSASGMRTGLDIVGHATNNNIDVNIGYGTTSRTTINGQLKCNEILNFDGVALTTVQKSDEGFSDDDVSIMTSAAIKDYVTANSSDISITGTTTNGLLSYGGASAVDTESELTYDPSTDTLGIGADNSSAYKIKRVDRTNGAGGPLEIIGAKAAGQVDLNGGNVVIRGGVATGQGNGGNIHFYSTLKDTSLAGTTNNPTQSLLATISGSDGDFDLNSKITNGAFKGTNIGTVFEDAIYLTPGDFNITSVSRSDGDVYTNDDGGSVRPNSTSHNYHAFVKIPIGYQVSDVDVKGSNNSDSFEVFSSTWNNDATQSKGTAAVNTPLDLSVSSSNYTSVEGGYLVIQWDPQANTSELYGAKLTLYR